MMADGSMNLQFDAGLRIQNTSENAISADVETARNEAANTLFVTSSEKRADDYHMFVALIHTNYP